MVGVFFEHLREDEMVEIRLRDLPVIWHSRLAMQLIKPLSMARTWYDASRSLYPRCW